MEVCGDNCHRLWIIRHVFSDISGLNIENDTSQQMQLQAQLIKCLSNNSYSLPIYDSFGLLICLYAFSICTQYNCCRYKGKKRTACDA